PLTGLGFLCYSVHAESLLVVVCCRKLIIPLGSLFFFVYVTDLLYLNTNMIGTAKKKSRMAKKARCRQMALQRAFGKTD
ncbi:MAG: hypothetical protein PUD16_06580, partial [bacterium]|nr:hypothetical protein [bacterium]